MEQRRTSNQQTSKPSDARAVVHRISHDLRLSAAERLVSTPNRRQAARSLIASAATHGIDLDLMWGTVFESNPQKPQKQVRQCCLAVLGAGRTAMLFFSHPEQPRTLGARADQIEEIGMCLQTSITELAQMDDLVGLAQTLFEPKNTWAHRVCTIAEMTCVGELAYMRRPLKNAAISAPDQHARAGQEPEWPSGIEVRPIRSLDPDSPDSDLQALICALEGSYEDTLDCPELCGLRSMTDVVDSHRATGVFDPSRWLLIYKDGSPAGCCLLSHCPASNSVELVYLGIAPAARGLGLGRRVLGYAIDRLGAIDATEVTCAVDTRNAPAIRVYESLGFSRFDSRIGFVKKIP